MKKLSDKVEAKLLAFRKSVDYLSLLVADKSKGDMHQIANAYNQVLSTHEKLLVDIEKISMELEQLQQQFCQSIDAPLCTCGAIAVCGVKRGRPRCESCFLSDL
jgi:hypothetical protein